jgi:hypothetical protein
MFQRLSKLSAVSLVLGAKQRMFVVLVTALFAFRPIGARAYPIVLSYHTSTVDNSHTTVTTSAVPAVKYDLPDPMQQYEVLSLGIWSRGVPDKLGGPWPTVFPANTKIVVRIWDANGSPLYTSDVFDFSGQPCDLDLRTMNIDQAHVQVSGSFYVGYQEVGGGMNSGTKWITLQMIRILVVISMATPTTTT